MTTWLKATALAGLAVLAPIQPMLWAALTLVVVDTVSGIFAARKRGEAITSAKLRRAVSKALVYVSVLIVSFVAGKFLLDSDAPAKLAAGLLGGVELLSCLENLNTILGGDLLKGLIAKLGSANDKKGDPK